MSLCTFDLLKNAFQFCAAAVIILGAMLEPDNLLAQETATATNTATTTTQPATPTPQKSDTDTGLRSLMPWEYRPYKVHCWMGIDPSLNWDKARESNLTADIQTTIENRFGPTVEVTTEKVPQEWEGPLLYSNATFDLPQLLGRELVIATTKKTKEGKESRTVTAALERFQEVAINPSKFAAFQHHLRMNPQIDGFNKFAEILKPFHGPITDENGDDPVAVALLKGDISIGVISRSQVQSRSKELNALPLVYPWHLQTQLSDFDKIIVLNLKRADYGILIEVREIDCLFRSVSKVLQQPTISEQAIAPNTAQLVAEVFVPYVRMESSDDKVTKVRLRAGELIPTIGKEENPCYIGKGDVLRPIIRRDNLRGEPQMIQYLPWTYLVAFNEEQSNLDCAIFSGVRSQLLGRPNRRLYRMATLVKPSLSETELKLRVGKNPTQVIPGNSIFRRTPGSDDLVPIGRSDWRGVIAIDNHVNPVVTYEIPAPKPETNASASNSDSTKPKEETKTDAAQREAPAKGQIQANAPLYFYFVKSGNSLLAKLPIVTGDEPLQIADLPDDSRRLEAEAFIRGLEGRIFDIVALRLILASKIEAALEKNDLNEARVLINQLKTTKNYEGFSSDLNAIQSRILADAANIPRGAMKRIDKMFADTRVSLQKYLQDSQRLRELEIKYIELQKANGVETPADSKNQFQSK